MTEITEEYLKSKGFKKANDKANYRLSINLPYPGERFIEAGLMPHDKWICYYMVGDLPASEVKKTTEGIEKLYLGITGKVI